MKVLLINGSPKKEGCTYTALSVVAKALNEERIKGAGIDVFDYEPPLNADYPLLNAKNTILTPHVAYYTKEAMIKRANIEFNNVINYLKKQ